MLLRINRILEQLFSQALILESKSNIPLVTERKLNVYEKFWTQLRTRAEEHATVLKAHFSMGS